LAKESKKLDAAVSIADDFTLRMQEMRIYHNTEIVGLIRCHSLFKGIDGGLNRESLLCCLFKFEYGAEVGTELCKDVVVDVSYRSRHIHILKGEAIEERIMKSRETHSTRRQAWPQLVSDDVLKNCANNYYESTIWRQPIYIPFA